MRDRRHCRSEKGAFTGTKHPVRDLFVVTAVAVDHRVLQGEFEQLSVIEN